MSKKQKRDKDTAANDAPEALPKMKTSIYEK